MCFLGGIGRELDELRERGVVGRLLGLWRLGRELLVEMGGQGGACRPC